MDTELLDKNTLRARALGARKAIKLEQAHEAAQRLSVHLFKFIPQSCRVIAGYMAIHGEISVAPALAAFHARGHMLALPVVIGEGKPLIFRKWQPGAALEKGAYGIDVPPAAASEIIPDAVIVPLAAFDAEGHRLGYGAGYYDRTIPKMRAQKKEVLLIGAAYSQQQVEHIPVDEHDRKLDAVVTEKGVIVTGG
jgi:5-formyltetrahydrofolate cyclo-ligase